MVYGAWYSGSGGFAAGRPRAEGAYPRMAIAKLVPTSLVVSMRFWRVLFLLMLVVLHFSAMRGAGDLWARALMLAHFGLFIIWQPFMRGERRLTAAQTFGMVAISVAILFFLNWWLLALRG